MSWLGLPLGLCANKDWHIPHINDSKTLGKFFCIANQCDREPYRSEQRRKNETSKTIQN